jgi:hypothetical protein
MEPIYTHPIYKPISRNERWALYREHPLHGVRVTYHAGRGEYLVSEVEYFGSSDAVGREVGIDLVTTLHSEITERIDQVFESYLVPARLSEMMEEFIYRA